ncbi:hypothetical protein [Novosphingobium sp. AP12]|uniref:hypothetical protein n=1 Tax=Novosphingobium sp. AP12 TaxID=1144305 RepID=UPI0012FB2F08|nr:hypothetical protein [Novosphingobium sp. AP12]
MIRFTLEMDNALRGAHCAGLTLKETGEIVGVSDEVISRRKRELNLPPLRPWAKMRAIQR